MGGFFGVVSKKDCVPKLFYGTDYHSHLGTRRGGLATLDKGRFTRFIHDITNAQFRSKFEDDILRMKGMTGIGVISDYEDQPLIIGSHLGRYAIATVGVVKNENILAKKAFGKRGIHFSEMSGNEINPTELIAMLINQEESFEAGIKNVQEQIEGSCSILLLTEEGIYASRDRLGRTPVIIGKGPEGYAVTMESCAFPNLGYTAEKDLGPGETVLLTPEGIEQKNPPGSQMQICSFLWIYYGYPASSYEGINVEAARYRCGAALAEDDNVEVDYVSGIPDSGVAHALGYAAKANIKYCRPFVKYTPTWPRSFMPQQQKTRDLVAKMKLIPIRELTEGRRLLFCEDSIVRGTQLKDTLQRIYDYGACEIHMRPACPPLAYGCKFLNFSRSRSELDLAARKAISELEGQKEANIEEYVDESSDKYNAMVTRIGKKMGLTTLRYQKLDNMIRAIRMPKEKLCTFCWTGKG
ncbi:MAG: amidophosphoribosyltransferase [Desulfobacterales bacterium S7086C20]|nr:MAG: amidophosphoribosyltransferase [Desulfobacterales bacterium S7086C20]